MKSLMPFSSGFVASLKWIVFALAISLVSLLAIQPKPPQEEGHFEPQPQPAMTPHLKQFYQRTAQINPGMTEAQIRNLLGPPSSVTVYPIFNSGHSYEVWQWDAPDSLSGEYLLEVDETGHSLPAGMYPD